MHVRTKLRHRIVEVLLDVPDAEVHRDAPVRLDQKSMFDDVTKTYRQHILVTSLQMDPLGKSENTLDGCCVIPASVRLEVSLFVSSDREGYEQKLDDVEASVWPALHQFNKGPEFREWPELIFTGELTQPSSPEAMFSAYVRSLQFSCDILFDPALPHVLTRL